MISLVISNILPPLFVIAYVWCRKLHKKTWGGWSFQSLEEWVLFLKLAIPGLLMLVLEWSAYEVLNFIAGALSETELAVNIAWFQIAVIIFMVRLSSYTQWSCNPFLYNYSQLLVLASSHQFELAMHLDQEIHRELKELPTRPLP